MSDGVSPAILPLPPIAAAYCPGVIQIHKPMRNPLVDWYYLETLYMAMRKHSACPRSNSTYLATSVPS